MVKAYFSGKTCGTTWCQRVNYLELYSFAKSKIRKVQKALTITNTSSLFHLPLSVEACSQLQQVTQLLESLILTQGKDYWSYIW